MSHSYILLVKNPNNLFHWSSFCNDEQNRQKGIAESEPTEAMLNEIKNTQYQRFVNLELFVYILGPYHTQLYTTLSTIHRSGECSCH